MYSGPKIVKNGLVFGLDTGTPVADTGTATRFYKGESTSNLSYNNGQTDSQYLASTITWVNAGSWTSSTNETDVPKPVIPGLDTSNLRITSGTNTTAGGSVHYGCGFSTVSPSTTYTVSVWFRQNRAGSSQPYLRTNVTNVSLGNLAYNGDTNSANWPIDTWIRISATGTTASNENGVYISNYIGTSVGDKIWYFGHQVEAKSHATPLIAGTRSNTNSLIDLVKSNTITMTNSSFDASAIPYFDGTDDYFEIADSAALRPSTGYISTELVFRALSTGTNNGSILINKENEYEISAGGGYISYAFRPNWAWVGNTAFNINQWYHLVITYDQSNQKMYINNSLAYSAALTGAIGNVYSNALRIGARGAPGSAYAFFNGNIPVVRIYNRALSATEVESNFRAYQKRFNI